MVKAVTFNSKKMLKYYIHFDVVEKKYSIDEIACKIVRKYNRKKTPATRKALLSSYGICPSLEGLSEVQKKARVKLWVSDFLQREDSSLELASLTKKDVSHVVANLNMIYNTDPGDIEDQVHLMNLISDRVIGQYLRIEGLERLFNELYVDFEWEMHLGMDHKRQRMQFYRDHFLHQVRDAYMMDKLLKDGGFYQRVYDILSEPSNSKVSDYFNIMVQKQRQSQSNTGVFQRLVDLDENFVPRNIIYMACYMAGLFHDIGYPETYLRTLYRRICDYIPNMHRNPNMELPSGLFSLLQNSLLFRVVPYDEIQKRVTQEAIDHGTLSALGFLLHFYENGEILRLEPYKAAAVELAALAIYNHTYKYSISGEKKADDYRPLFVTNPISYLLRICDDLQEWDRVYFEISERSNILLCSSCHTPIIGQREGDSEQTEEKGIIKKYVCNCDTNGGGIFNQTFGGDSAFPYRRLYNVQVCKAVEFRPLPRNPDLQGCSKPEEVSDFSVCMEYDPFRLLHIAYIRPTYAKYRIEELNKVKPLLMMQRNFPRVWLDYFVTSNPLLIKVHLLHRYFTNVASTHKKMELFAGAVRRKLQKPEKGEVSILVGDFQKTIDALSKKVDKDVIEDIYKDSEEKKQEQKQKGEYQPIICYLQKAVRFYIGLALIYDLYLHINELHDEKNYPRKFLKNIINIVLSALDLEDSVFRCLVGDCLLQLSRCYSDELFLECGSFPEDYTLQFVPGDWERALTGGEEPTGCSPTFYHTAVERYTDQQQYIPLLTPNASLAGSDKIMIDAFTDLGLFQKIDQLTRSEKKKGGGNEMNKPELVSAVAEKAKITKKEAAAAIDALFETIAGSLKKGEKVQFVGFGTFDIYTRNARKCRNPHTGEEILVPASKVPVFRTGRPLKEAINK